MEVVAASDIKPRAVRPVTVVTRAMTAPRLADMSLFQDAPSIEAGLVMVLGLDGVLEHLGSDWQGRRTEVYDRANRILAKRLNCPTVRLSETDYLIAQPGLPLIEAEDKAVRALREIVTHFVGEASASHLRLFRAERVCEDHAVCAPLDAAHLMARADRRQLRDGLEDGRDLLACERWDPFVASHGRTVRPSCSLEPVLEISSQSRIGYRVRHRLTDMATGELVPLSVQRSLSRADVLRIDNAALSWGIERFSSAPAHEAELSLVMPVSYFSLSHPQAGARLRQMFARARDSVRAGVICEIYDIEGISETALGAATALVRPWSLFVVGYLGDEQPRASPAMKAAGIQVLAFDAPKAEGDAEFIGSIRPAISSARRVGRSVMVYGCQGERRLALAGLLGATHASLAG